MKPQDLPYYEQLTPERKQQIKKALYRSEKLNDYKTDIEYTKRYTALVRKSNTAVQKARYSLTLRQQKLLCYLITLLKEDDTPDTEKTFDILDYYTFMGVTKQDYSKIKKDIQTIANCSWWKVDSKGKVEKGVLFRFIDGKPRYIIDNNRGTAKIIFQWDSDMLPHLQDLKKEYTQYKIWYIMTLKSEYSLRLYELLKSVENKTFWQFSIEQLKSLLMCDSYTQFSDFRKRVIDRAVTEINNKTDINVSYELFKLGNNAKMFSDIEFTITPKETADRLNVDHEIKTELDGQINLFDTDSGESQSTKRKE